jgi:hypothetical protein
MELTHHSNRSLCLQNLSGRRGHLASALAVSERLLECFPMLEWRTCYAAQRPLWSVERVGAILSIAIVQVLVPTVLAGSDGNKPLRPELKSSSGSEIDRNASRNGF